MYFFDRALVLTMVDTTSLEKLAKFYSLATEFHQPEIVNNVKKIGHYKLVAYKNRDC